MSLLQPPDFRYFALRITPDKSSAIVTLIERLSNRVSPLFKIHLRSSAPAHKSQILEPLSLAVAPPGRNYHGITSLCIYRDLTSIDSHPCGKTGGWGSSFFHPPSKMCIMCPITSQRRTSPVLGSPSGGHSMKTKQSMPRSIKNSVKAINVALSVVLLLSPLSVPAHADFKYTDSTKMTGAASTAS